jgi:hypothetical protein
VETRHPTREEWLRFLANPNDCEEFVGIAFIGTIADILQLAEECKKGTGPMGLRAFEERHKALCEGQLVAGGMLHTLELDRESLLEAAFTGSPYEDEEGITLWSEVATKDIRPWRTLRRLILREVGYRWWGPVPYLMMEELFGEEAGRNG